MAFEDQAGIPDIDRQLAALVGGDDRNGLGIDLADDVPRVDGQGEAQARPPGELLQALEDILEVLVVLAPDLRLRRNRGRLGFAQSGVMIGTSPFNFLVNIVHADQL
ncbi:MAG: hypothetical protein R3D25_02110 [Geminicoccaceae bacterium]